MGKKGTLCRVIYELVKAMNTQSYAKHSQNFGWDFQILPIEQLPRWHLRLHFKAGSGPTSSVQRLAPFWPFIPSNEDVTRLWPGPKHWAIHPKSLPCSPDNHKRVVSKRVPWTSELYFFLLGGEFGGLSHTELQSRVFEDEQLAVITLCACVWGGVFFLLVLNTVFSFSMRKSTRDEGSSLPTTVKSLLPHHHWSLSSRRPTGHNLIPFPVINL